MSDRLSTFLHDEAASIDVPPPPAHQIIARGRQARRRRAQVRGVGAAALVAACAVGLLQIPRADDARRLDGDLRIADTTRALSSYASGGAYAVGDELVMGADRFEWNEPIKALHYTSAGVVIQSGENPDRDEGGSRYALVTPTGEWSTIDVALDDQIAGFEPSSPRFAYAEPTDGGSYDLVVHDAASDEELARTSVDIGERAMGWRAPPVAIHGDVVWVRGDEGWTQWDWRTGRVSLVPGTTATYELAGGRYADWAGRERWLIRSMESFDLVRELDLRDGWYGFFSPDGRYLRAFPNERGEEASVDYEFFSVDTGQSWRLEDVVDTHERVELGWSPDGHVLRLLDSTLSWCDPDTGACEELASDIGAGTVRLGGEPYGS